MDNNQLEREPVGEPRLTPAEARKLTDRIKRDAESLWELIKQAYLGRAWIALNYPSWDVYCANEFGSLRLRLPREEREAVVRSLLESGLSNRAVASTLGVSEGTVRNDQKSGAQFYAPETDAEADELAEELIEAGPTRPIITGGGTKVWPATRLRLATTTRGLDGKSYRPFGGWPKPPKKSVEPTVAERFEREMGALDHLIDRLSGLVAKANDTERAELAARWADELADYERRLGDVATELFQNVTPA
jgi:hypothetical protein